MVRKSCRWLWKHWKLTLLSTLFLGSVLVNTVAYMHAYSMTHFTRQGDRTPNPEKLSFWQKAKVLFTGVNIPRPANAVTPDSLGLSFTVHRFASGDSLQLEAWHISHPKARGLVLMFHGYSAAKGSLLREAQAFYELGYATFLVDFRGSGGSDGDETTIGVYEADDVACAWDYARAHWPGQPMVLFGQSMGSAAILRAVGVKGIQPRGLILECPFDSLLSTVANRFESMRLPSFPFAQLLVCWGGIQNGFNGFEHKPVVYAAGVHCPTLMLHGNDDVRVTRDQAASVFANLTGEKELQVLENVGHTSYVAADPRAWKRLVRHFLDRWIRDS